MDWEINNLCQEFANFTVLDDLGSKLQITKDNALYFIRPYSMLLVHLTKLLLNLFYSIREAAHHLYPDESLF